MWLKIMWGTASRLGSLNYISRRRKEKEFKSRKNVLMKAIHFIIKKVQDIGFKRAHYKCD